MSPRLSRGPQSVYRSPGSPRHRLDECPQRRSDFDRRVFLDEMNEARYRECVLDGAAGGSTEIKIANLRSTHNGFRAGASLHCFRLDVWRRLAAELLR